MLLPIKYYTFSYCVVITCIMVFVYPLHNILAFNGCFFSTTPVYASILYNFIFFLWDCSSVKEFYFFYSSWFFSTTISFIYSKIYTYRLVFFFLVVFFLSKSILITLNPVWWIFSKICFKFCVIKCYYLWAEWFFGISILVLMCILILSWIVFT